MSSIDSTNPYRVQGAVTSIAELARKKPGMVFQMPAELAAEAKLHDEQQAARREAEYLYAQEHPDQVYAQVTVGGKVVATVYDSGVTLFHEGGAGVDLTAGDAGLALADARLADILKAVPGEVKYDDFAPPNALSARGAPESALPKLTARSLVQIMQDLDWNLARTRMAGDDTPAA